MMKRLLICFLVLGVALSACSPAVPGSDALAKGLSLRAWFDAPLPGTVFYPPNPCQIVAHGASPGGIAAFELSINGAAATIPSPDPQGSLVTLSMDCGLTEPGKYVLLLRAQDHSGKWSGFAETNLVIAGGATPSPTLVRAEPVLPSTATPTLVPAASGVSIERISRDVVNIGRTSCGPMDVSILARATAPNPIQVVVLFYRFEYGEGPAGFESVAMNPQGEDLFQATLNPTALLGGVPFEQATLQYQVVVQQSNGDLTVRTPVLANIAVQACGPVDSPPAPAASCSDNTTERTCIANGCAWVSIPSTVPLFECRAR